MDRIEPYALWIGNLGDTCDVASLHERGIEAVVFLAQDLLPALPRELILCRFPLLDGAGNVPNRLRVAIDGVAGFISMQIPTLVACSNGMSRSPCIVAAALGNVEHVAAETRLRGLQLGRAGDVSPGLWQEVLESSKGVD